MEIEQAPLLMLGFPRSEHAFLISLISSDQVISDASEAVRRGGDSFWRAKSCAHSAVVVAERWLVVMQGMSRNRLFVSLQWGLAFLTKRRRVRILPEERASAKNLIDPAA